MISRPRLLFLLFLGVLIFDGCAEYLFFDEFGTRFNFIAVDYLLYTQEVIGNIWQSSPAGRRRRTVQERVRVEAVVERMLQAVAPTAEGRAVEVVNRTAAGLPTMSARIDPLVALREE